MGYILHTGPQRNPDPSAPVPSNLVSLDVAPTVAWDNDVDAVALKLHLDNVDDTQEARREQHESELALNVLRGNLRRYNNIALLEPPELEVLRKEAFKNHREQRRRAFRHAGEVSRADRVNDFGRWGGTGVGIVGNFTGGISGAVKNFTAGAATKFGKQLLPRVMNPEQVAAYIYGTLKLVRKASSFELALITVWFVRNTTNDPLTAGNAAYNGIVAAGGSKTEAQVAWALANASPVKDMLLGDYAKAMMAYKPVVCEKFGMKASKKELNCENLVSIATEAMKDTFAESAGQVRNSTAAGESVSSWINQQLGAEERRVEADRFANEPLFELLCVRRFRSGQEEVIGRSEPFFLRTRRCDDRLDDGPEDVMPNLGLNREHSRTMRTPEWAREQHPMWLEPEAGEVSAAPPSASVGAGEAKAAGETSTAYLPSWVMPGLNRNQNPDPLPASPAPPSYENTPAWTRSPSEVAADSPGWLTQN